jgi:hypothetical protein
MDKFEACPAVEALAYAMTHFQVSKSDMETLRRPQEGV